MLRNRIPAVEEPHLRVPVAILKIVVHGVSHIFHAVGMIAKRHHGREERLGGGAKTRGQRIGENQTLLMIHRQKTSFDMRTEGRAILAIPRFEGAAGMKLHFIDTALAGMRHPPLFKTGPVRPGIPDEPARRPYDA
ncbi:hypothetical protein D3C78_1274000 [compost metagenome]